MSISKDKKILLVKYVNYYCEQCKKKFELKDLRIHRIKRGNVGGTYKEFRNLMVLCKECHKLIHANELGIGR